MRFGAISLAILVLGILSAAALGATAAKDPAVLVLRKADFAAGASYYKSSSDGFGLENALDAQGLDVNVASAQGRTYSSAKGTLQVSSAVWAPASVSAAKKVFAVVKRQRGLFWRRSTDDRTITMRSTYGAQQLATYAPARGEGIAFGELIVRRNTVVWLLHVYAERRRPSIPTKAELLGQLQKYAAKQRRRVGAG